MTGTDEDLRSATRSAPVATRRRAATSLVTGTAVTSTAMVAASTVGTLIGAGAMSPAWSGLPNAAGLVGTAAGTVALAGLMSRRGSRTALTAGYLVAAVGALVAGAGVVAGSTGFGRPAGDAGGVGLLVAGMVLLGIGNGGAMLSRYCAAEMYPPDRRGWAIGMVVWGGTVGALLGPNLMAPTGHLASGMGLPGLSGPYLLALACALVAAAAATRLPRIRVRPPTPKSPGAVGEAWRNPAVRLALTAMTVGQVAMVAVMAMTPLHMQMHGHGLGVTGIVISAHMAGMFALAPLSGRLVDRYGPVPVVVGGIATLVASSVLAVLPPVVAAGSQLSVALFLLGYGWNLTFVGGSGLLSLVLPEQLRIRAQGGIDALVLTASAVASVASGTLLAAAGFATLAAAAGVLVLLPLVLLGPAHRAVRAG
jgi:MFS family permease